MTATGTDLGRFAEGFMCFRRVLSNVDQPNRWIVFQNIAREAATYVAKGLGKVAAGDELTDIAEANGLIEMHGVDAVQRVIADAFASIEPPERVPPIDDYGPAWERDDEQPKGNGHGSQNEPPPLPFIDIARDPIPPRAWAVLERIPAQNVTLLSGEGAVGKSVLMLQLMASTVLGRDWIGTMPEQGPVIYFSCEDDEAEVRRRLEAIANHYGSTRADMMKGGLHVLDLVGKDAILGEPDKHDRIRPTALFEALRRDAMLIRPKIIGLDTAADVFAGKENDRAQTRQFLTLLRALAIDTGAAVVLASHPSLTGISTGTGLSGNTAWHNSVRARMYFKPAPGDNESLRVLEVKKNNYGPVAESIVLRWRAGVYVPEPRAGTLEQLAADAKVDDLFLMLLRRFTEQGRNVSDKTGTSYAPAQFTRQAEAKAAKVTSKALAEAMDRLFVAKKIKVATEGPPSHPRTRLIETASTDPSTDIPPPSTEVCVPSPYNPPPGGRGKGAVEAPAPSTGKEGEEKRWPSREEWAKFRTTLYADEGPESSWHLARFANEAEISTAIAALENLWRDLGRQMKTASKKDFEDLRLNRRGINRVLKDVRAGKLPAAGYIPDKLTKMFAPFYARQHADDEARWEQAEREKAATPIDDEAWEKELRRRKEQDEYNSNPDNFIHRV